MANGTGIGTTWTLPNFHGELFTASQTETPLLSMIGGTTGGMMTDNWEFPTGILYERRNAKQPKISEKASTRAPESTFITRRQEKNVVQIHQERVELSYKKQSSMGRLSGINTAGKTPSPTSEMGWQLNEHLITIANDIEYSFINGEYHESTGEDDPATTRGIMELTKSAAGTHIDAAGADLEHEMLKTLYRLMSKAGAKFRDMIMMANAYNRQAITDIYSKLYGANLPATRTDGGISITNILTDFFQMGVIYNPHMPEDAILITDIAFLAPVFQPVPDKGVLFIEELAKQGASDDRQLYTQVGLAHGPAFLHGSITGLGVN